MKLAAFIFLSTALHAAALAYPALFLELRAVSPVAVTILDAGGDGDGSVDGGAEPKKEPALSAPKAEPIKRQQPAVAKVGQIAETPKPVPVPAIASEVSRENAVPANLTDEPVVVEDYKLSSALGSGGGGAAVEGIGEGVGSGSGHGGVGTGSGDGSGSGNGGAIWVKASYDNCPVPEYPEIARARLGGTVILRVLVDEEGKPKRLEVKESSGFGVLDQAAVKHVKQRCRFHPARHGDKRVESLVELPVVFKLANVRR